jgi:3,2-trans-enoyl-CoA isomerase
MELYAPKTNLERYRRFWTVSNKVLARISGLGLVTIAALNGSCPAGGCCLSLACDFRLASSDVEMGLNETALGIPVPEYWVKLLCTVVGQGKADKMVQFAQMVPAKDGLRIGLVDQIVEKREDLLSEAEKVMGQVDYF